MSNTIMSFFRKYNVMNLANITPLATQSQCAIVLIRRVVEVYLSVSCDALGPSSILTYDYDCVPVSIKESVHHV